jgi:hypothetical protein
MFQPPPTYKLKIETDSEHQALVLLCEINANGLYSAYRLLSRHIRFLILAKEIKGKAVYKIELKAHEALAFTEIVNNTLNTLEGKLSAYNRVLYQSWNNDINQNLVTYYLSIEN